MDTTPPAVPGAPAATAAPGTVTLSWAASTDNIGVGFYRVYRSTSPGFSPGPGSEIAQTTLTGYSDNGDGTTAGLPAATYYYKLVAVDLAGNLSAPSSEAAVTVIASRPDAARDRPDRPRQRRRRDRHGQPGRGGR